ncbi:uncharacterized protein LOC111916308 [Lactuca sativa]|uniref:Uncharacterized protein n=1 Tax=Lactuca sativa TaxID=4236 RepID=A0A9R1W904_LACSA|nr:uncharacterized protein LOC111916308 [Lactuca sativa]XP_052624597.1 uncharacterized protein LOC111916308 [Lactuca sativa]KAJ0220786.1 hypothetical protein LSAT_V11C200089300 [Lactuca sativa]
MNRQTPYGDASVNRYGGSQSHASAQRMQQHAQTPQFPFRGDGRQQWNTIANPQIELNPMSPHSYSQGGHKGNMKIQSQERMGNQKYNNYENQGNKETRLQSHEQEMEVGYEDNTYTPSQLSFEGMEQRFQDEIMKLIKDLSNAEDAENARHKERIVEINMRYQENLCSLRAQHASRVGEFVGKESETRLHHYQQAANAMTERGPPGGMAREARRRYDNYGAIPDESSYREYQHQHQHPQYREHSREPMTSQGYESRVPHPHGRVYNNSGAHY